jgi:hypothetical protein
MFNLAIATFIATDIAASQLAIIGLDPHIFRCDPFARDVAFDPGRASAPRIAVPHMLPSSE